MYESSGEGLPGLNSDVSHSARETFVVIFEFIFVIVYVGIFLTIAVFVFKLRIPNQVTGPLYHIHCHCCPNVKRVFCAA